jgi:hypothetical protein
VRTSSFGGMVRAKCDGPVTRTRCECGGRRRGTGANHQQSSGKGPQSALPARYGNARRPAAPQAAYRVGVRDGRKFGDRVGAGQRLSVCPTAVAFIRLFAETCPPSSASAARAGNFLCQQEVLEGSVHRLDSCRCNRGSVLPLASSWGDLSSLHKTCSGDH